MLLASALDSLDDAENPSPESLVEARQVAAFRNLALIAFVLSGGGLAGLGL